MPETVVERIARILEPQAWAALGTGDTLSYKNRRTSSLRKATAVLQALREPTEAMADAFDNMKVWDDDDRLPEAREAMEAFIDAALSEGAER